MVLKLNMSFAHNACSSRQLQRIICNKFCIHSVRQHWVLVPGTVQVQVLGRVMGISSCRPHLP